ncbi:MAG: hypothetical protein GXY82_08890 [Methanospirillum sp.]|nr:hypothetical protein [Methanospirillum sp.]
MAHATRCGLRPCGWGVSRRLGPYLDAVGLALDDYALAPMETLVIEGLRARTPLLTIEKPRLVRDLVRTVRVHRRFLAPPEAGEFDLVVDATGIARALLPPCRSDLVMRTLQCRVRAEGPGDRLPGPAVRGSAVPGFGYTWAFPLGGTDYHVGVGAIGPADLETLLERSLRGWAGGGPRLARCCACGGAVRVSSPYYATPFFSRRPPGDGGPRLVVGAGESIGTVGPFTGEGILPSLECARLLADRLGDPEGYTRAVLARFGWMRGERETLDRLLAAGGGGALGLRDRWRFYRNARRSGIRLPLAEAVREAGRLSRWVDGPGR